jgi:hypothetical protein
MRPHSTSLQSLFALGVTIIATIPVLLPAFIGVPMQSMIAEIMNAT